MLRAAPAAAPVRDFLRASPEPIHHLALGPTRREAAARVSSIEGLLLCGRPTTTLRTTLDRGVRLRAAQHQRRLRAIFSPWPELGSVSVLARSGSQGRRFAVRGGALTLPDRARILDNLGRAIIHYPAAFGGHYPLSQTHPPPPPPPTRPGFQLKVCY